MMRIVALSDTHGFHQDMKIPDGDILLHCGDLSYHGHLDSVLEFDEWFGSLPHKHKIAIAGNHDRVFEEFPDQVRRAIKHFTYLQDDFVMVEGLKIWGSPWQPEFFDWAFNLSRGQALAEVWAKIPLDTDILLTHGPPEGFGDHTNRGERVGCADLLERIQIVRPKLHCFGHIHEDPGVWRHEDTLIANVSTPFGNGAPFVFDLNREKGIFEVQQGQS